MIVPLLANIFKYWFAQLKNVGRHVYEDLDDWSVFEAFTHNPAKHWVKHFGKVSANRLKIVTDQNFVEVPRT